jgi:two-component system LytT family response regulator
LLEGFCPEPSQEEQIAVNSNGLMLFLRLADIEWMETADNCVKLRVGKQTHRLRDTLAVVAAKLPPGRFLRISRSTLVNVEHIMGVQRMFFDEYEVLLRNGARLPLTRAYLENLRQIGLSLPALTPPINRSPFTLGSPASNC